MNPIKAQRTWHSLSTKWLSGNTPFGRGTPLRHSRRKLVSSRPKIKRGTLTNLIPVEVVNAITGEVTKGYMRDLSIRRLRKWLALHNYRAQVELVYLSKKSTFFKLNKQPNGLFEYPILIKLGTYQVPYLIENVRLFTPKKGKPVIMLDLKTVDNLKYLELIAEKKKDVMKLFNKIKKAKKK
jgi:hypothetical protein